MLLFSSVTAYVQVFLLYCLFQALIGLKEYSGKGFESFKLFLGIEMKRLKEQGGDF